MKHLHREVIGYTVIVLDKYILCGTANDLQWKDLENLGRANIRHYKSLKILLNNLWYHMNDYGSKDFKSILDTELSKAGYLRNTGYYEVADYRSKEALNHLIDAGLLKVVELQESIDIEKEVHF